MDLFHYFCCWLNSQGENPVKQKTKWIRNKKHRRTVIHENTLLERWISCQQSQNQPVLKNCTWQGTSDERGKWWQLSHMVLCTAAYLNSSWVIWVSPVLIRWHKLIGIAISPFVLDTKEHCSQENVKITLSAFNWQNRMEDEILLLLPLLSEFINLPYYTFANGRYVSGTLTCIWKLGSSAGMH